MHNAGYIQDKNNNFMVPNFVMKEDHYLVTKAIQNLGNTS